MAKKKSVKKATPVKQVAKTVAEPVAPKPKAVATKSYKNTLDLLDTIAEELSDSRNAFITEAKGRLRGVINSIRNYEKSQKK